MATLAAHAGRERAVAPPQAHNMMLTYHRLMLVMLLFIGVSAIIGLRLTYLQVFTDRGSTGSAGNPLLPARGDIVDRNGVVLASTIDAWTVGVHPNKLLGNPGELAVKLHQLMPERSIADYHAILTSGRNYMYLRRRALPELVAAVNALGEPAIAFSREPERLYPQTALAGHVLGWTDLEGHGVAGMERVLNDRLLDPHTRGAPVALSIDSRVQAAMELELAAGVTAQRAEGGTGIMLDVRTGEVVAMASAPTFNPNNAGHFDPSALYNRATMGAYELGSTFKPLTVAAAIDAGVVKSIAQRWDAASALMIGRHRIGDSHPQNRALNAAEILVHSSNIGTARIGDQLGPERMQAMFRGLGFHERAHVEIRERSATLWPRDWGRATVLTTSFGHGIAITPLHLATAYAALVNGGVWRPATLLRREPDQVPAGRRVFSETTSAKMRQLLRLIVTHGSGRRAEAPGFRVGGKTGTAEKVAEGGGYNRRVNVSTFAAAFPMDNPRYVVIVMMDAPKGTQDTFGLTTAAWTAAPIVSKVIARSGPLLGVIPSDARDVDNSQLEPLVGNSRG